MEASAPASTSEMPTRAPSTPPTTLLTEELAVTPHARPVPNPRPLAQPAPSISLPAPPLPPVPYPRPNTAVLHIGTSRKRTSDEFRINRNSQLESDTPSPSKHRK
ncbi:hypothetical protein F4604DRAFT_1914068 [Suillus subluteus]|nr:hypothetical protein F4604DRAFT_1914068 [Suillus subluteus]